MHSLHSNFIKMPYFALLCWALFYSVVANAASPVELQDWYDRFGSRHKSSTYADSTNNELGQFQRPSLWGQSGSMRALVEVHKGHHDDVSLRKLAEASEHILMYTSEKLGFIDVLQHKTLPAWGTGYYSCDMYRVSAVHTGVLVYPMAYFSKVVLSNPSKYAAQLFTRIDGSSVSYLDLAKEILVEANRAVESHAHQFDEQEGAYLFPSNYSDIASCDEVRIDSLKEVCDEGVEAGETVFRSKTVTVEGGAEICTRKLHGANDFALKNDQIQPYNMTQAMGMAHIELSSAYKLLGGSLANIESAKHLERALMIAKAFKRDINLGHDTELFDWRYLKFDETSTPENIKRGRIEDVSHAGLVLGFVTRMFEESLVFSQEDIQVFIDTFYTVTQNASKVHTHVNYSYGSLTPSASNQRKAQRGIISWTPLAIVDPKIYDKTRQIFHQYGGGYDANNWYGEAVLLRFSPKNIQYPILARSPSDHKSYIPNYGLRYRNGTGLYRNSLIPVTTIDGKSASSCAEYAFSQPQTRPLQIEHRQVQSIGGLDSCSGGGCNTSPGFHVFTANLPRIKEVDVDTYIASGALNEADWSFADSLPLDPSGGSVTDTVASNQAYNRVLICRSGAGSARDNISVRYVGVPLPADSYVRHVDDFISSEDGWLAESECADFSHSYQHGDSGHSQGFLKISEARTYTSSEAYVSCRPSSIGRLNFAYYKDQLMNYGHGFRVSGWTKFESEYSGNSRVNNRCVKVLDATQTPEVILASACVNWSNTTDTGWRYFDYDFTSKVGNVPIVRVVIGGADSWKKNWNQTMSIDNIEIKVTPNSN